jgi:hypothetical protein
MGEKATRSEERKRKLDFNFKLISRFRKKWLKRIWWPKQLGKIPRKFRNARMWAWVNFGAQEFGEGISRLQGILENANMLCHDMLTQCTSNLENFITAKSWCYKPTPLKRISPSRFRKRWKITWGSLLWALLHDPMWLHSRCGDSTVLYTSWWPYCESLALRYAKSWSASHCRSIAPIGSCSPGTHRHFLSCDTWNTSCTSDCCGGNSSW